MKLNKLFIFPLLAILASCSTPNNAEKSSIVTIKGTILNPRSEVATFRGKDTTYTANVDSMGQFSISFSLDSATYLDFFNGPERTAMYVYPGDDISLSIDTKLFDETISYEGSPTSSYLAKKYLMEEGFDFFGEIYFMSSEEEYNSYISDYKDSVKMNLNLISDTSFVAKELKEMTEYYAKRQASMSKYSQSVRKYKWESNKVSMDYNFYVAMDSLNAPAFDSMLMNFSTELNQLLSLVDDTAFVSSVKSGIENKNKIYLTERTSFHSKIEYDVKNSNLSNLVLGIEYENPGLIFGLALIESNELDWFKLINENTFNEYNRESFRIYFELKGLGSLGRKINQYTDRKLIQ